MMNVNGVDGPKKSDSCSKLESRRPRKRCTYIVVAITIVCVIILCTVLPVVLTAKSKNDCPKGIHCDWRSMPHSEFLKDERCDFLCTTRPCISSAHYALSRIDASKDPCEDFYEFACGTYEQQSLIFPEGREGVFTDQEAGNEVLLKLKEIIDSIEAKPGKKGYALRLAKRVYDDCMNTDHHPDVVKKTMWKSLFSDSGRMPWPLLNEKAMNDDKHFVKMMSSSLFYDVNPFIWMSVPSEVVVNNKTKWLFRFSVSSNLATVRTIYNSSSTDDEESSLSRYFYVLEKVLTEVGIPMEQLKVITSKIEELERHFLEVATEAEDSNEKVYKTNHHLRYEFHNHSCEELDNRMPHIKWCRIVGQLSAYYGLPENSRIRIELPSLEDYFGAINTVMGHFLDRDIINYIALKFFMGYLKYTPSPLRQFYYREPDLFTETYRFWTLSARWQQCVEIVSGVLWIPLEKEFVRKHLDEEKQNKIRKIAENVKDTYLSALDEMSWLKALFPGVDLRKQIQNMKASFGNLDQILSHNDTALDSYYEREFSESALDINSHNPLLTDVLLLTETYSRASVSSKRDVILYGYRSSFELYNRPVPLRKIDIPYAVATFSMALSGRPMFSEYATLGSLIFDHITASLFLDWDNFTVGDSKGVPNCLQEQSHLYKTGKMKYKVKVPEQVRAPVFFLKALGTIGSFQTYMDYLEEEGGEEKGLPGLPFTNEQLFFISSAQAKCEKFTEKGYADLPRFLMSPARHRVNVPFANLKAFSDAFRCPSGSSMNPKRKCCVLGDGQLSYDCNTKYRHA